MATFNVICHGSLPHSALVELRRRRLLVDPPNADPDGNRGQVLRIEGAFNAGSALAIAREQVAEAGGACEDLEITD